MLGTALYLRLHNSLLQLGSLGLGARACSPLLALSHCKTHLPFHQRTTQTCRVPSQAFDAVIAGAPATVDVPLAKSILELSMRQRRPQAFL